MNKRVGLRKGRKDVKGDREQKEGKNYKTQKWSAMTTVSKILKIKM